MVAIQIGEIRVRTLDDEAFGRVLAAAERAGGAATFPLLFALPNTDTETDAPALFDEIVRLSAGDISPDIAIMLGQLRDDLMEAVSVASEG